MPASEVDIDPVLFHLFLIDRMVIRLPQNSANLTSLRYQDRL